MAQVTMIEAETNLAKWVSALEQKIEQSVTILKNGKPVVEMTLAGASNKTPKRKIGVAKGKKLYAENYDIDAEDKEILDLFGV